MPGLTRHLIRPCIQRAAIEIHNSGLTSREQFDIALGVVVKAIGVVTEA